MKEKILAEAERLFWKYGVRTITMDDIARRLAISKKTIYQHFTDKEDIVYQVVEWHMTHEQNDYCRLKEKELNPIEEIVLASNMMRQHADKVNPSLLLDVQRYFPKAWEVFLKHKENHITKDLIDNLQRGVEQGLYRADFDIETMARLRIELIQLGFDERVFPHQRDVYTTQDQLLDHYIRGILSERGLSIYEALKTKVNEYNLSIYENK
ncbi:TetR/AcrR family transcriptional regulator [Fibrella sp. WM1]|uniref:TetR/AcrR family transcriptional regulator n=1 Tax=Fibrella musci TaxID=3242485 RepID=UPI003520613C